jgi:hypothetical protein
MLDIIWEPIFYPKKILGSSSKIMGQYLKKYTPPYPLWGKLPEPF